MRRGGDRRLEETSPEELEECFWRAKDDLGLDHCEARSWHGWHRHMSLCMAALAFLSTLSADLRRSAWSKPNERSSKEPIAAMVALATTTSARSHHLSLQTAWTCATCSTSPSGGVNTKGCRFAFWGLPEKSLAQTGLFWCTCRISTGCCTVE
ncbi:transposase [Mesorhizobium amorphae CCNWGS0123]|uniref:Transposase n=1 Tax=Mesorhizobium amorphae CCNWGS0123 TaxID=1082933 RepID=G6Y2U5_9HYPH|nr:transposase [Mesorhizobium amorphae CCNWGS0123]